MTSPKDKDPASRIELMYRFLLPPAPDCVPHTLKMQSEKSKRLPLENCDRFLWDVGFPNDDRDKGYKKFCQHSFL